MAGILTKEGLAKLQQQGTLSMEEQDKFVLMEKKSGFPCHTRVKSVNKMLARGSKIVDPKPKPKNK